MQYIDNKTNNLLHPIIQDGIEKKATSTQKICNIVLPILSLYQPAGTIINAGYTVVQLGTVIKEFPEKGFASLVPVAYLASTTALLIFFPIGGLVIIHGLHLFKTDSVKIGSIFKEAAFLSSKIIPTPETLLLSLFAHAASEFHEAYKLSSKCEETLDYLEVLSKMFIGSYKLHRSRPVMSRMYRNWFGKEITQKDFVQLMTQAQTTEKRLEKVHVTVKPEAGWKSLFTPFRQMYSDAFCTKLAYKPVDLGSLLKQGNYSSNIKNIEVEDELVYEMNIKDINFINCRFVEVGFEECNFSNVNFNKCDLFKNYFTDSRLESVRFHNSNLFATDFYSSILDESIFWNSTLLWCDFSGSKIRNSSFIDCKLPETSFFHADVASSKMVQCDLKDTLLTTAKDKFSYKSCTKNVITRPIVASEHDYEFDLEFSEEAEYALRLEGLIVLHYEFQPKDVNSLKLKQDVLNHLQAPQNILKSSSESIDQINAHADEILTYVDGLLFPGGQDIQPELYGAANTGDSWCSDDYRQSLLQMALVQKGVKADKLMLGICRGSQMINVALGGTLIQDVGDDELGFQKLKTTPATPKVIKDISESNFYGLSAHHQACDKMGDGLKVTLKGGKKNITKAFTNESGTIIGYQFHPEIYWEMKELKSFLESKKLFPLLEDMRLSNRVAWSDKNIDKNRQFIQLFADKLKEKNAAAPA